MFLGTYCILDLLIIKENYFTVFVYIKFLQTYIKCLLHMKKIRFPKGWTKITEVLKTSKIMFFLLYDTNLTSFACSLLCSNDSSDPPLLNCKIRFCNIQTRFCFCILSQFILYTTSTFHESQVNLFFPWAYDWEVLQHPFHGFCQCTVLFLWFVTIYVGVVLLSFQNYIYNYLYVYNILLYIEL